MRRSWPNRAGREKGVKAKPQNERGRAAGLPRLVAGLETRHGLGTNVRGGKAAGLLLVGADGEAPTALRASVLDDLATTGRRHASAETVGADAAKIVGLERAFHRGFREIRGIEGESTAGDRGPLRAGSAKKH